MSQILHRLDIFLLKGEVKVRLYVALMLVVLPFALRAHGDSISLARHFRWHLVGTPVPPDSCDSARLEKNAFWRASAETVGFNIGLWAFDRYVQKGHYAYISFNTIKENFKHGFEWDDDHLSTNMFAHPYNGSLFYNAGRSNGFNFWQSELFAIGGSAMWEMFMECEYPSTNDIIATPVGGAAIGEVLYRASDLVLDDRTTGGKRFGRELAAFIISPMRGFTRIVTGRAWERRATTGRRFGTPPISVSLSVGSRMLVFQDDDKLAKAGGALRIGIEYGDRFAASTKAPYDYFSFIMELNAMKTQPLLSRVEIIGRLLSCSLVDTHKCGLSVGMYQHFDYFDSDTISSKPVQGVLKPCVVPYKLGTPASVGGGAMFRYNVSPRWAFDAYVHANAVILGGVLSDYYRQYHRNYNWSSGFSFKFGLNCNFGDRLSINLSDNMYRLYTWGGYDYDVDWSLTPEGRPTNVQGDASNAWFNHLELRADYRLWKRLYATVGLDWYYRKTSYERFMWVEGESWGTNMPIIWSHQAGVNLMLTYVF